MDTLPKKINAVLEDFVTPFNSSSFKRFKLLLLAAILTTGSRTVCNLLRTVEAFMVGHRSSYHSFFSKRRWSMWALAHILICVILKRYSGNETIYLAGDDTVEEHPGRQVFGKGKHRDAVRSSHTFTAFKWGHKWVVLSILVKFPFANRPWALPVLVALYYPPSVSKDLGLKHRTPSEIMRILLARLTRWFPERKFIFSGDGGYAVHELAKFCQNHKKQIIFVSKFYPNANLFSKAYPLKAMGRPRVRGDKLPSPDDVVKTTKRRACLSVNWYGGEKRRIEVVTGSGFWYRGGCGAVEIRWVFVHDLTGTHRDEYFFTTDVDISPKKIVEVYTGRWSLEVTFEEVRAYVGFGSTRGRARATVTREAPCLLGLFSLVAVLFEQLPKSLQHRHAIQWVGKKNITFSDAITTVRRWLWKDWIFKTLDPTHTFQKLPAKFQRTFLYGLAPAA